MSKEKSQNKIKELMSSAMKDLNSLIDVNTVIGTPFKVEDGTTVIPISKVTMGFMTGGGEYGEIKKLKDGKTLPFAGGSSAIISVKPSGFLIDKGKGVQLFSVPEDTVTKLFESAQQIVKSLKNEENI
ncbi:MAG: sporulation protein YtfJ [Clostridiales bacterium]|nr:sporulation protein YtfJ [Clostridiales bacterium]